MYLGYLLHMHLRLMCVPLYIESNSKGISIIKTRKPVEFIVKQFAFFIQCVNYVIPDLSSDFDAHVSEMKIFHGYLKKH